MKTCSICRIVKPESKFYYRNRQLQKLHSQCKDCYIEKRRQIWKQHYHKYGSKYRARAVERNREIKVELRQNLIKYLSDKSCAHCGIRDSRVLEFDHLDPELKSFGISQAITRTMSWAKVVMEIQKCQILCANCHKIKTAQEQGWYKNQQTLA